MFTGIVTDVGEVLASTAHGAGLKRIRIACAYPVEDIALGASIACSGPCLTVVKTGRDGNRGWFEIDAAAETLRLTTAAEWTPGTRLNLERALKIGDELGGHIVTGHVDGIGTIVAITETGGSHHVTVRIARDLAPFVAAKGSITVDGVSLTVNAVADDSSGCIFHLNIIPHTWDVTTFADLAEGQAVNIEIDTLARYLQRMRDVLGG